jgi:hypothetical protein
MVHSATQLCIVDCQEVLMILGTPIGGQRIVDYDDRDLAYSRAVPTADP